MTTGDAIQEFPFYCIQHNYYQSCKQAKHHDIALPPGKIDTYIRHGYGDYTPDQNEPDYEDDYENEPKPKPQA